MSSLTLVVVGDEADLVDVERLGPVHIGDREDDELEAIGLGGRFGGLG